MSQEYFNGICWLQDWAEKMERMSRTAGSSIERSMCRAALVELIDMARQL